MPVRALVIAEGEVAGYRARWDRLEIQTVATTYEYALSIVNAPASPETIFDAVVIYCADVAEEEWSGSADPQSSSALSLAQQIRSLPNETAMFDGRKWAAIPLILICSGNSHSAVLEALAAAPHPMLNDLRVEKPSDENNLGGDTILGTIESYRLKLLSAFDDMGFIVRYEAGRFIVGPAYKPRKELEDQYYFGASDKRPNGFTTLHKDHIGLQLEVEQFEALINREDIQEQQLQQFFEEHPHFLSTLHTPLPHVRLRNKNGKLLIPDFVLKPIVAQQRDSRWQVLELKLPQEQLLTRRASRRQLSANVMSAVAQLRDYRHHFEHADAEELAHVLGHPVKRPRLGVLIGRLANTDVEALEEQQRYLTDVTIVTYDEILEERQASMIW
jgi:hypothetical protein